MKNSLNLLINSLSRLITSLNPLINNLNLLINYLSQLINNHNYLKIKILLAIKLKKILNNIKINWKLLHQNELIFIILIIFFSFKYFKISLKKIQNNKIYQI